MVRIKTRKGWWIQVDEQDAYLLTKYRVSVIKPKESNTRYVRLLDKTYDTYIGLLHNVIVGFHGVDHIDGNGLHCERSNLRKADQSENQRNRKHTRKEHKGVYWRADRGRWTAKITLRGKLIVLGCFDTYEDAKAVRIDAEAKYFGIFNGIGTQQQIAGDV